MPTSGQQLQQESADMVDHVIDDTSNAVGQTDGDVTMTELEATHAARAAAAAAELGLMSLDSEQEFI